MPPKRHLQHCDGNAKLSKLPRHDSITKSHAVFNTHSERESKRRKQGKDGQQLERPSPVSSQLCLQETHPQVIKPLEGASLLKKSAALSSSLMSTESTLVNNARSCSGNLTVSYAIAESMLNESAHPGMDTDAKKKETIPRTPVGHLIVGVNEIGSRIVSTDAIRSEGETRPISKQEPRMVERIFRVILLLCGALSMSFTTLWFVVPHIVSLQCHKFQRHWEGAQNEMLRYQELLSREKAMQKESTSNLHNQMMRIRMELEEKKDEFGRCQDNLHRKEDEITSLLHEVQRSENKLHLLENDMVDTQALVDAYHRNLEILQSKNSMWQQKVASQEQVALEALNVIGTLSANRCHETRRRLVNLEKEMIQHKEAAIEALNFVATIVATSNEGDCHEKDFCPNVRNYQ